MNTKRNNDIRRKIAGAVYGFAIGDSMGATTEFMTDAEIKMHYEIANTRVTKVTIVQLNLKKICDYDTIVVTY